MSDMGLGELYLSFHKEVGSGPRCAKNKTKQLGPSVGDKHFSQQLFCLFITSINTSQNTPGKGRTWELPRGLSYDPEKAT